MPAKSDSKQGEFGPPLAGETLREYMLRVGAHPELGDRRVDAPEDIERALDKTEECLGQGVILTGVARRKRKRRS